MKAVPMAMAIALNNNNNNPTIWLPLRKKKIATKERENKKSEHIVLGLLWASAQSYARGNGL